MTQILLVRHGETDWNAAARVQGWTDTPLSGRGRAQAAALAARLARQAPAPVAVYASDLSRARDTAQALAASFGLPVATRPALRERGYGAWEGLTLAEVAARYPDEWDRYHRQQALDVVIPGGETWEDATARVVAGLRAILADHPGPDDAVLVVGHGGSLRAAVLDALAAPLPCLLHLRLDNASLSRLDYRRDAADGAWRGRLLLLNDTAHLDAGPGEPTP